MAQKRSILTYAVLCFLVLLGSNIANAQEWKSEKKVNVLFGISQILASGFNIEGNYINKRFIADYSHGVSLDFKDGTVTSDLRRQGLAVHIPYTTGFGIGYRLKEWVNIRIEPKWHRFEFYYENDAQTKANQVTTYNTFSLGVGVYGSWLPFKKSADFLHGMMISPSIRYWPTVHSSQSNDFVYYNRNTMMNEKIKTLDPGIGFTPWVVNISVGYSFSFSPKKVAP
jgi:hypothetical protein